MEIEIPRSSLSGLLVLAGLSLLLALGYELSPRDEAGRPRLLLPDVRAVEAYRTRAAGWANDWRALDTALVAVLASPQTDLLQQSRRAQGAFDRAMDLAGQVEGQDAPPTLVGLREQVIQVAASYADAATAANRWLSAPSDDNLAAAQARLVEAQATLAGLEANQWLHRMTANTATPEP